MQLSVPHPFEAAPLPRRLAGRTEAQRKWQLRFNILATTRRLLAEQRYDGLKITQIAQIHGVTDQTIYNNFGRKYDLVRQALEDHTALMNRFSWAICKNRELFPIILSLSYFNGAVNTTEFYRNMMLCSFSPKNPIFSHLHTYGTKIKVPLLREISQHSVFRPFVNPIALSEQITHLNSYTFHNWANSKQDFTGLYEQLMNLNTLLLLGSLEPAPRTMVENWLADFATKADRTVNFPYFSV